LLDGLQKAGIAVQLKHDSKETTWESHGYVKVIGANGKVVAEHESVQHNRQWGQRTEILSTMVEKIIAHLDTLKKAEAPVEAKATKSEANKEVDDVTETLEAIKVSAAS